MTDMRQRALYIERDGKTYALHCNFAVLAAVDFDLGGVSAALKKGGAGCAIIFAEAMLNECAERCGWPERFDRAATLAFLDDCEESCGRLITDINTLVLAALAVDEQPEAAADAETSAKN